MSTSDSAICAVSHIIFDAASTNSNPNQNPLCGMKLRLERDGRTVDVVVVDRCTFSLSLSSLFFHSSVHFSFPSSLEQRGAKGEGETTARYFWHCQNPNFTVYMLKI
jgi:hypothetical protein